jgi:phage repressor protein C with HTH and peptisase S24 domain
MPKPLPFFELNVFAGPVDVFFDEQPWLPDGMIYLPDVRLCDCALRVRGDSMSPVIENNDIIAVKLIQDVRGLCWKKPYVIITAHQRLVKYIYRGEDDQHILLVSANRQYEPERIQVTEVLYFYEVRTVIKQYQW